MKSSGVSYTLLLSLITPPPTGRCLHCIHMSAAGGCEESFPACVCVEMCCAIWVLSVNHVFCVFFLWVANLELSIQSVYWAKKHVGKPFSSANKDRDAHTIAQKERKKKHTYYYLRNKETRWERGVYNRIIVNSLRLAKDPDATPRRAGKDTKKRAVIQRTKLTDGKNVRSRQGGNLRTDEEYKYNNEIKFKPKKKTLAWTRGTEKNRRTESDKKWR